MVLVLRRRSGSCQDEVWARKCVVGEMEGSLVGARSLQAGTTRVLLLGRATDEPRFQPRRIEAAVAVCRMTSRRQAVRA